VGIEPAQLICRRAAKRHADNVLVRVEHLELAQELFGLAPRVCLGKNRLACRMLSRDGSDELDDRLMRYSNRILRNPPAEEIFGDRLLFRKAPSKR
jgi:hypothetical protein